MRSEAKNHLESRMQGKLARPVRGWGRDASSRPTPRKELQRRQVEDSTRRAEQEQSPRQPRAAQASFVPVRLAEEVAVQPAGRIEIELSSGRRVHVTAPVDRQTLADVLAVLEGRHPEGQAC